MDYIKNKKVSPDTTSGNSTLSGRLTTLGVKQPSGITLIELIVIIAIIGVLALIIVTAIMTHGEYRYTVTDQNGTTYYTDSIEYDGNRVVFVDQYGHSHVLTSYSIEEIG